MKAKLRSHVAALMLLAPVAATFVALPETAIAAKRHATPEIYTLSLNADEGLRAGSDLQFAVEGTPRGRMSVALGRTNVVVPLKETSSGMYRGTYTVRSRDKIDPTALITARLTIGKRTAVHNFNYPGSFQALAMGAPAATVAAAPRIDQFVAVPVGRIEPGRELRFRVHGVPGASASFDIPGVANDVAMREVSPGVYEGTYTVRQRDDLNAFSAAVATLRSGSQSTTARLARPIVRDREPPQITSVTPRPGEAVSARGDTLVAGTFEDPGGRGVDPASVRIMLSGRDITAQSHITPQQFNYRADLPPGRYTAEVTARDYAGNAVNKTWSFEVGTASMGSFGPLPLQVTSPANNATVDANGNLNIQGRTAPYAHVTIRASAVAPVFGNRLGVAQDAGSTTVQADRDGYFSAFISPRGLPIPGTRYEVTLSANEGSRTAEQKIVLFQRQG